MSTTTTEVRWPRAYWSGISDDELRTAAAEYRAKASGDEFGGLLLKLVLDIDDELERREAYRALLDGTQHE